MNVAEVLLNSGELWSVGEPASAEVIGRLADLVGAPMPAELVDFLGSYGTVECGAIRICGLGAPAFSPADAVGAVPMLHALLGDAATGYFPIERLPGGRYAVMDERGAVWVVDASLSSSGGPAASLAHYLQQRVDQHWERQLADLAELREIGARFGERHGLKTQGAAKSVPSSPEERPLRFCVQDHRLAGFSLRFDRATNGVVVGPTVFADAPGAPLRVGAEAVMASLLSEAYRTGGSRRIVFRRGLPDEVFRLAEDLGVVLSGSDLITEDEARGLLFGISGNAAVLEAIDLPESLSELVARHVLAGVWTPLEAEALLRAGPAGQRVVVGGSPAEWRLARVEELELARSVRLAQALLERLEKPEEVRQTSAGGDRVGEVEDAQRRVHMTLWPDGPPCTFLLRTEDTLQIDWGLTGRWTLPRGQTALVLSRGRSRAGIASHARRDLVEAADFAVVAGADVAAVLYPRDVLELAPPPDSEGTRILAAPSPLIELDRIVAGRLRRLSEDGE